ncbi:MAG TPA: hypothetical protein VMU57_03490 [Edaphobacter sp.]|uniref:hypothetical protein n=1 Tax=Edaphobacter sp. TaxID=1934404 RepID=UPI002D10F101|nr:hypothetical protein [Edaphobacter sp.]HUZ93952.1 hypothetical protein [Edaphobacter sp.]
MNRKSKIIIGFAVFFAALLIVLFFARKQFVGGPGSPTVEGSRAVIDGGIKIPGWNGRVDGAEERAGMTLDAARLAQEGDALHVTTGPATTYWETNATASGDFTVKATFNEPKYMNRNSHAHPYGIFIGGNDMGTSGQTELYCAAFGNGKFIVRGFGPEPFRMNGLLGDSNNAVHRAAGRGQPVTQDISVSVRGNKVECSVNGSIVASYDKAALIGEGKLKSTDGFFGLRFAHNTDVLVSALAMSKD